MEKFWHYFFPVENSGMTEIRNIFKDYTKDIEKFDDGLKIINMELSLFMIIIIM